TDYPTNHVTDSSSVDNLRLDTS
ncbi:hypothetical protein RRG08_015995, partial [Elysia crispata]